MQTLALYNQTDASIPLLIFVFAGTLTAYSLHRWVGIHVLSSQRLSHVRSLQAWWPWMILVGGLASFYAFLDLTYAGQIFGALGGALSVAYILPINKNRRIRDIPGLKIFLISMTWATTTVLLPWAESSAYPDWPGVGWHFLSRALFIFAITLPFDLRDLLSDEEHHTLTLPLLLGWPACLRLGLLALTLSLFIDLTIGITAASEWVALTGNIVALLISGILLIRTHRDKPEYYFSLIIDGVMYLPWLITLLLYWISNVLFT
ncbi:MAG: hypothetical protein K9I85_00200 [Saprospiraceae bacterium]|nr:hypothetical protein [Saprospiraceae bacterium]